MQNGERKDKQKKGQNNRPTKANVHVGVKIRDLQGPQRSLTSVELMLRVVLKCINEDRS